jgi:uncharacterized protein YoxC
VLTFVAALRELIGTEHLPEMRKTMAKASEQITALNARVNDLIADVRAATDILKSKAGDLDTEGQAALDALSTSVSDFDAEVGDADGSDTPANPPVAGF